MSAWPWCIKGPVSNILISFWEEEENKNSISNFMCTYHQYHTSNIFSSLFFVNAMSWNSKTQFLQLHHTKQKTFLRVSTKQIKGSLLLVKDQRLEKKPKKIKSSACGRKYDYLECVSGEKVFLLLDNSLKKGRGRSVRHAQTGSN